MGFRVDVRADTFLCMGSWLGFKDCLITLDGRRNNKGKGHRSVQFES